MTLTYPWPRPSCHVVLLGAGASFGARVDVPAPVMKDFIRVGRRLDDIGDYGPLWKLCEELGYPLSELDAGSPNLEELYTALDAVSVGLGFLNAAQYTAWLGSPIARVPPVFWLEEFISEVVNRTSVAAIRDPCPDHAALVDRVLSPGDVVISFNYDLLMDVALDRSGLWGPKLGYGFHGGSIVEKDDRRSTVALLKPHGSLNWSSYRRPRDLQLKAQEGHSYRPISLHDQVTGVETQDEITVRGLIVDEMGLCYDDSFSPSAFARLLEKAEEMHTQSDWYWVRGVQRPERRVCIVPPTMYKFGAGQLPSGLADTWAMVRKALETAGVLTCIGYSFPQGDLHFSALLRLAVKRNVHLDRIEIVNPDTSVADRLRVWFPSVSVLHTANSLKEYVSG